MRQSDLRAGRTTITIKDLAPIRRGQPPALARWRSWQRHVGIPYLFLLPFLVFFILFFILPLGYALDISVFNERLVGGTVFVGLTNYLHVFSDGNFWFGLRNVVLLLVVQVPVMLIFALILALLLSSQIARWKTLFRLGYFLPYAIPSVIGALLWGYLYSSHIGPFVQIAAALHLPTPGFLTETGLLPSIGNMLVWQWTGYNMIVMYAALQAIPLELYDAARVDGASGWNVARYIKIPLIAPALFVTAIFSIIGSLQLFNEPQIMSAIVPQIVQDHYTPNMYAYNLAFTNQEYNYSAAVSFVLGGAIFVFSYIFMLVSNRRSRGSNVWQR